RKPIRSVCRTSRNSTARCQVALVRMASGNTLSPEIVPQAHITPQSVGSRQKPDVWKSLDEVRILRALTDASNSPAMPPQQDVLVRTYSGSLYRIIEDAVGNWWFCGSNIPNLNSIALPEGMWRIECPVPWPPQPGVSLFLRAWCM